MNPPARLGESPFDRTSDSVPSGIRLSEHVSRCTFCAFPRNPVLLRVDASRLQISPDYRLHDHQGIQDQVEGPDAQDGCH